MRRNLNGELAVELAGGLVGSITAGSNLSLEDGRRDKVGMSEAEECWNRGVGAVAEALGTRAVAEGEARSPEYEPFVIATKMPKISLKTFGGRLSAVIVVGFDCIEEDSVEGEDMFVALKIDISAK